MGTILNFPNSKQQKDRKFRKNNDAQAKKDKNKSHLSIVESLHAPCFELPSFESFAKYIKEGKSSLAGEDLSFLLGISQLQGIKCARIFAIRLEKDPNSFDLIEQILSAIKEDEANTCLMLLSSCFGLAGPSSVIIWQHLKSQA